MKQILIGKTESIKNIAGTKFSLSLTKDVLPSLMLKSKELVTLKIPLNLEVVSGGEDWMLDFKLAMVLAENGVMLLAGELKTDHAKIVLFNLSETELSLEEGLPLVDVTLVQSVAFRQVNTSVVRSNGVIVLDSIPEERKQETQVRKARKGALRKKKD